MMSSGMRVDGSAERCVGLRGYVTEHLWYVGECRKRL